MDNTQPARAQGAGPPEGDESGTDSMATTWRDNRNYLLVVAARILRDDGEAEDVVAEAFARLADQPEGTVRDGRGWLIVVVRRLALDRLRSAHLRLSEPADPTESGLDRNAHDRGGVLGGGPIAPADPADRVTLDDEIRRALSVVVDRLTPGERAAFVLHDVFGVPFADVGELVGRSTAACRKLASRARASIRATDPVARERTPPPAHDLDQVAERFAKACEDGDVARLAALLHHDTSGWAMRRGHVWHEVHGRAAVSTGVVAFFGPKSPWCVEPFALDDAAAVLVMRDGAPAGLIRLATSDHGLITQLRAVLLGDGRERATGVNERRGGATGQRP